MSPKRSYDKSVANFHSEFLKPVQFFSPRNSLKHFLKYSFGAILSFSITKRTLHKHTFPGLDLLTTYPCTNLLKGQVKEFYLYLISVSSLVSSEHSSLHLVDRQDIEFA